jgi:pre-mRNA-splicing factor ATP-dependent RNA helicase DHX38/PRP16
LLLIQCVTAVDAEWLAELGPMFFTVRKSHESRLEAKRKDREERKVMEEQLAARKKAEAEAAEELRKQREVAPTPKTWSGKATTPSTVTSKSGGGATPRRTPKRFGL